MTFKEHTGDPAVAGSDQKQPIRLVVNQNDTLNEATTQVYSSVRTGCTASTPLSSTPLSLAANSDPQGNLGSIRGSETNLLGVEALNQDSC